MPIDRDALAVEDVLVVPARGVEDRPLEAVDARRCPAAWGRSAGRRRRSSMSAVSSPAVVSIRHSSLLGVPARGGRPRGRSGCGARRRARARRGAGTSQISGCGENVRAPVGVRRERERVQVRRACRRRSPGRCCRARCRPAPRRARARRSPRCPPACRRIAMPRPEKPDADDRDAVMWDRRHALSLPW